MEYDVVAAGEILIDLVSSEYVNSLQEAKSFEAHPGGSPANFASNLRQLGVRSGLISSVGNDAFGRKLEDFVSAKGLDLDFISRCNHAPTSQVLVAKTKASPDFEAYRGADQFLTWPAFEIALQTNPKIFHTTCFALSALPARSHILRAAAAFTANGARVSIDANYAEKIWPDRLKAQQVLHDYLSHGALVKMSEDDWFRLYKSPLNLDNAEARAQSLIAAGAHLVCFTFGADGAFACTAQQREWIQAEPIEIVDATGAGDSFWAGFIAAYIGECDLKQSLKIANLVASIKLKQQGPLSHTIDWKSKL